MHNPTAKTKSSNNDTCYLIMFRRKVIEKQRNNRRKIGNISISIYFRFSTARYSRLKNKLLANYLRSGGNELATVRISASCVTILSNNFLLAKVSIYFYSANSEINLLLKSDNDLMNPKLVYSKLWVKLFHCINPSICSRLLSLTIVCI